MGDESKTPIGNMKLYYTILGKWSKNNQRMHINDIVIYGLSDTDADVRIITLESNNNSCLLACRLAS